MKSPEYCYAVARLYRLYIDALSGASTGEEELSARREEARLAFSRSPTEAWLFERGGANLTDASYPGHRGVAAARVVQASGGRLTLDLSSPLGLRDGLLGFQSSQKAQGRDYSRPIRFPVLGLRDARSGRDLFHASAGNRIEIDLPMDEGRPADLRAGSELRRISARELDRKVAKTEEYEASREELILKLSVSAAGIEGEMQLPRFDARECSHWVHIEAGEALPLAEAKNPGGFERALSIFSESGDSDFRLLPLLDAKATLELQGIDGPRSIRSLDVFIPPSILKREKNRIYTRAHALVEEAQAAYSQGSMAIRAAAAEEAHEASTHFDSSPPRSALSFSREDWSLSMPFALPRDLADTKALPAWGGRAWLPLAPLVSDIEAYRGLVREKVAKELKAGSSLVLGIGALHHIALARELLAEHPESATRLSFFLDFNFYMANSLALASIRSLLPRVEFAYRYLEAGDGASAQSPLAQIGAPVGEGFEAPLFQSLGCFKKHHIEKGVCPPDCSRSYSAILSDRDRRYTLLVEDCVCFLFRKSERKDATA